MTRFRFVGVISALSIGEDTPASRNAHDDGEEAA